MKCTLVLALVSITLLVTINASQWIDVKDRIKDRVIHIETLFKRGRWLWQDDNKSLYLHEVAERDTYYTPRVQFQTSVCGEGKYLCIESVNASLYYLFADSNTVKLKHSTYPEGDNRFHWKVLCLSDTLERCKFVPVRYEGQSYHLMFTTNNYNVTLGYEEGFNAYFRVHAPNPTDGQNPIYENTNTGNTEQLAKYSTSIGVSQTHETSSTVSSTVSMEVGGAFRAFSSSMSTSISSEWSTTDSTTYEAAKTVEHDVTLPPRTRLVLKQLIGNYAGEFKVGADVYSIEEHPLDGGEVRSYTSCPKSTTRYQGATLGSQGSVTWPTGSYDLAMSTDGCPYASSFSWEEGTRYHDCEDKESSNDCSSPCHLKGPYDIGNMNRNFCVKTSNTGTTGNWPAGEYCIYRKGGTCPSGMSGGWIYWDDEDGKDNANSYSGTLPDGAYDQNTSSEFCFQTSGQATTPITLPTDSPFILYQYGCQCQEVVDQYDLHGRILLLGYIR